MSGQNVPRIGLGLSKAAHYLGVSVNTMRLWADDDEIPSTRTPGGHRRFMREDLDAFLDKMKTQRGGKS